MRVEDVSVYSIVNNKLTRIEEIMNAEECSLDELHSFLDSLFHINDYQ